MNKWLYRGKPLIKIPEGKFGFIYKVTCLQHEYYGGYTYIGQKAFYSVTHPRLSKKASHEEWVQRGSKRGSKPKKREVIKESKWQEYKTSSKTLNALIEEIGESAFKFEILEFASSRSWLNYLETSWIIKEDQLFTESFNGWISVKVTRQGLKDEDFKIN